MIFRRSLLRELTSTALGIFVTLLTIVIITQLIRLLGQAAAGSLAADAVIAMLGFGSLQYLSIILSLTLFISTLMVVIRSYRDHEMEIWLSSGISILDWIRPVTTFSLPIIAMIGLLSFVLSPWAADKSVEYKSLIERREEMMTLSPGVFKESRQANRVYFVEDLQGQEGIVANIFVQSTQHNRISIMRSKHGYQATAKNGDRFLVLLNGKRYEGTPGSKDYRIIDFERYAMRIQPREALIATPTTEGLPTRTLLLNSSKLPYLAELHWRASLPISAFILGLFAIPLGFFNPRGGRSFNLIYAILIYMLYNNTLSIAQAWIVQGKLPAQMGMWPIHTLMLVLLAVLFYRSIFQFSRSKP